jgi:CRP/FNR family transcriptional regulator
MQTAVAEALQRIPLLAGLDTREADTLFGAASLLPMAAGDTVFHAGAECRHFLVLIEGSVRVTLNALSGRSVTLYRIEPGDTCVLTTSCLMSSRRYPAEARAETPVTALAMARPQFDRGLEESAVFRRFVLDSFSRRLAAVIERMESVALTPGRPRNGGTGSAQPGLHRTPDPLGMDRTRTAGHRPHRLVPGLLPVRHQDLQDRVERRF